MFEASEVFFIVVVWSGLLKVVLVVEVVVVKVLGLPVVGADKYPILSVGVRIGATGGKV